MKEYWHIALVLFCVLVIISCRNDDEILEVDEVWKVQDEEAFQAQVLVPGLEQLSSQSDAGFILYKVLKTEENEEPIYHTSKVECYYKGSFINGEVFGDRSPEAGEPTVMEVYRMTDDFATALQNMHPDDEWEIWALSQLEYGEAGYKNPNTRTVVVGPCTAMIFGMGVVGIVEE